MGTLIVLIVFALFLTAILTGGYNKTFLERVKNSKVWDWLTTVDHKKIGILYFLSGFFFFLVGGIEALFMRLQLVVPHNDLFVGDTFNELLTMHGTTMIFMAAMPMIFGLMNAVVPLQIGARDVAFPFVNALGFWLFFAGGLLMNLSWIFGGAPDAGWTSYTSLALNNYSPGPGVDFYVLGLQIAGIGTLIGGLNFMATIINLRAPGMTFLRMPMFTWTSFVTSTIILFAFPPLTVALLLLMFDRLFGSHFFDYTMGGSAVIWEHLFWIFGHPEVYIVILPAFGVMSEVISTFSRKRLFGYTSMVFATVLIAFLSFMVWVHHMFTVGLGPVSNSIFAVATMAIAVPTGIKVFNWLFTMWGGEIRFTTAMLFAIGFIPTFVMGGMTGVMLAAPPADFQYQDSYFVVAHFHYVLVGGTVMGLFAGAYYWWPKMFGKMLNETIGKIHFWTFLIGFHLTFFPQHFLGLFGMPRRVFTYQPGMGLDSLNLISTIGVVGMAIGTIAFLYNIYWSFKKAAPAPADPWDGRTLEWAISSPPPVYNFAQLPLVRGYDAWWMEKQAGNKSLPPAEPLGSIHMPSSSFIPILMALGFFIAGFGFIFRGNFVGAIIGLVLVIVCLFLRSFDRDHGYHIEPDEIEETNKGVQA
ncbi:MULTISPECIES: cytochrome c oxidase subunit I [unclassified Thermoactinomyces]|jgi:cytochrome c oxidase subunit I|uniref:cytochrome c oxidase subunit I n=1 Tax=unclassified Thermoactinomyces TaxID=2634588 RepID=UPI0018DC9E84|nr:MULTISPECIES: cytochrome c oxidase subunit I [unclassified Thermoactinomyces]MBH8599465.1 cytochrome c oxidase subunit I [Thermoactinomyces sp. CICC 10523]MBH8605253.1 cytochrome c oxidase subunit I [Thermoactinomyces sp. CICC 10522]MBH8608164.1 cytochrome c oxidase subunit I [Thermoactinomyces sp. CICC 10521]